MKSKSIRTLKTLIEHKLINPNELPQLSEVVENFSLAITDHIQQQIDHYNPEDPIAKQFVPNVAELNVSALEKSDPIGDEIHTTVKGIIHRYPDRCLFTPVHICPVYCRFCFRKEKVGTADKTLNNQELEQAFNYIAQHPEIWEVIITGGDPLIIKPTILKKFITRLSQIEHVEIIRIHTRVPVVDPERINNDMLNALTTHKPIYVVLHANHPKELSTAAIQACKKLIDSGIVMLSQTVLLKNINDNIETLSALMRCFIKNRIKPYYLHHGDLARGTGHFRTTIAEGQLLMKQLRGRFSGICQPTYVLDIPGGHGKVPIGPNYIKDSCDHPNGDTYFIEDYQGFLHTYSNS